MTYSAPTPNELREAARSACEGQPESELHKHPAWRAAAFIEQEGDRFLNGSGESQTPTGLYSMSPGHAVDALNNIRNDLRPGLEWAIARCEALQSQGFDRSRHDVLIKDFQNCIGSLTKLPE